MVSLYNARHEVVEFGYVTKLTNLIQEEVDAFLTETWMAYLFGERGDTQKAAAQVHKRFKEYQQSR